MAFDAGAVKGSIELDATKFLATMRDVQKSLGSVEASSKQTSSGIASFAGSLGSAVKQLAIIGTAYIAFKAAVNSVIGTLSEASDEAATFEGVVQRLGVTLSLTGRDAASAVEGLKEFADAMQTATGVADDTTLQIAQQLTLYGVARTDLEKYTKAVLDYASAFGVDATFAAKQFGQSLDGTAGRLAQTLPGIRALSEEALKAGGAFEIAGNDLRGFSEQFLKTTTGLQNQLTNSVNEFHKNLGAVFNPIRDEFTKLGTEIYGALNQLVLDNIEPLIAGFQELGLAGITAIEALVTVMPSVGEAAIIGVGKAITVGKSLGVAFDVAAYSAGVLQAQLIGLLNWIPGIDLDEEFAAAAEVVDELGEKVFQATLETDKWAKSGGETIEKFREAAKAVTDRLTPALDKAREAIKNVNAETVKSKLSFDGMTNSGFRARAGLAEAAEEAYNLQVALAASFREAENLAGATGAAATNLGAAADSVESGGGDGGDGGGGLGTGGIHRVGSRSLGLGSVEESLQTLRAEQAGLQSIGPGAYEFQKQGQLNIVRNVAAIAQAQVNKAFIDYTADIIRELNGAGIFNEAQRNSTIAARLNEAQRLGILPARNAVTQITGVDRLA